MKRFLTFTLFFLCIGIGLYLIVMPKEKNIEGPYEVRRISDGDTFVIYKGNKEVKVRMIGIDTPEITSKNGIIAYEMTVDLLKNRYVYLEYDINLYDKYGRSLAYVYLDSLGNECVEEILLKQGMAKLLILEPNDKYASRYEKIENEAKFNNTGFWKNGIFED